MEPEEVKQSLMGRYYKLGQVSTLKNDNDSDQITGQHHTQKKTSAIRKCYKKFIFKMSTA